MSFTEPNGTAIEAADVPLIVRGRRNPARAACAPTAQQAGMGPRRFSALVAFARGRDHLKI